MTRLDYSSSDMIFKTASFRGDACLHCYTDAMSHVSPVFTDYERRILREIAIHKVHPHPVHRVLQAVGKPFSKLLSAGRDSQNRALRGLSDRIHGWVEEGLIKTFKAANKITNPRDVTKRYARRGMKVDDIESLKYLPLSVQIGRAHV